MGNYLTPGNSGFAGLFDSLEIADDAQFRNYLNRYDVIYLDMTGVIGETSMEDIIPYIQRNVTRELADQYPELKAVEGFTATLANAAETLGNKFIMIIDEWDAPIREAADRPGLQRKYLEFLRSLFKNNGITSKMEAIFCWWGSAMTGKPRREKENTIAV